MPIYEFACHRCQRVDEVRLAVECRNSEIVCPVCDMVMQRVFTVPATKVAGLAKDRFRMKDKLAENRQRAHEGGWI